MILAFCFCTRDQELALENVKWWVELGGCKGHSALVGYDPRCDAALVESIRQEFVKAFDRVFKLNVGAQIDGWPQGANYFMRLVAADLQHRDDCRAFFWMEPDCVPLKSGWLDAIEAEYKAAGKPFMGDRVEVADIPLHQSGVGVYWNPLHQKAGEAYRAHDVAFDMAAKDQIVPQCHFTKLIEHAWKHPTFTNLEELRTQIRPEAVVFHSSKDGSLIKLLRQQKNLPVPVEKAETLAGSEKELVPPLTGRGLQAADSASEEARNSISVQWRGEIFDIFIRTYENDYEWLNYCVQAIDKFATGFRQVWIVSPHNPPTWMLERKDGIEIQWKVLNDETQDGYLAQQITKLYADVLTDYQADYILHIDSDVILTKPITPRDFFLGENILWLFTPYSAIQTPWQEITQNFLGREVQNEFMRRFPIMLPRWLYPKLREYAFKMHKRPIAEYVKAQPLRAFSEFNAIGAYAYEFHRDKFAFLNTTENCIAEPFGRQYHSYSGISPEIKTEIETLLRGQTVTPVVMSSERSGSTPDPAPKIKILANGIAVIEGDQISGWVEETGRLDHDHNLLPVILAHINESDVVIDAGAFIGDHSIAYLRKVGERGLVYAIEPNPLAQECFRHNLASQSNVVLLPYGLSDRTETVPLSGNNGQPSGAYVGVHMPIGEVEMYPLDALDLRRPNLIKIDVEGYEVKVLEGAVKTLAKHRPKLIIEINRVALERQGTNPDAVFDFLYDHGYDWKIIESNAKRGDPLYNIIALSGTERRNPAAIGSSSSLPVAAPVPDITPYQQMQEHVRALGEYCTSSYAKMRVRKELYRYNVIKKKR